MSKRTGWTYAVLADVARDRVTVVIPKALPRKAYDALQSALSRAAAKALTGSRRKKSRAR